MSCDLDNFSGLRNVVSHHSIVYRVHLRIWLRSDVQLLCRHSARHLFGIPLLEQDSTEVLK